MYDIKKMCNLTGCTVGELIDELQKLPVEAKLCCCGDSNVYLHVENDGTLVSFDTEDLEDVYTKDGGTTTQEFSAAKLSQEDSKKVYFKSICDKCQSEDCIYNIFQLCRFPLIFEEKPEITEEDGCLEYISKEVAHGS